MVQAIISYFVAALMAFFGIAAFCIAHGEKKLRKETEKKLNEEEKNRDKTAAVITTANKTKADARTGNRNVDVKYMADKLHHYNK